MAAGSRALGLSVTAALNPGGRWRGLGRVGRCPGKGLAVSFLLERPGVVWFPRVPHDAGDSTNLSSQTHQASSGLGPALRGAAGRPARGWISPPGKALLLRLFT